MHAHGAHRHCMLVGSPLSTRTLVLRPMPSPHARPVITQISADDQGTFERSIALAFGRTMTAEEVTHFATLNAPERSLAARDGDLIVGTTLDLAFDMTVPYAAAVPCAGVTGVGVRPTHRRRGILSSLMRRQLDLVHDRGDAWAALYASEAAIYGRFGYGMATRSLQGRIDRPWTRFEQPVAPAATELLDVDQALERIPPIYAAVQRAVPGMMSVTPALWEHHLRWDPDGERGGASERFAVAIDDRAYATYRVKPGWDDTGPDSTLRVEECLATDLEAHRQIWAFLFGVDLVQHVEIGHLAVDHPLPWWLAERRRLRLVDAMPMYIRLVDVGAALSSRGTRADAAVALDVVDGFCPWNHRRWLLEVDGGRLRCEPIDAPADVRLDVRELASLSLGGVRPAELVRAGLLTEHHPGAAARLEALLASDRTPWNAFTF